ncbi:chromate transporter [Paraherbaspirillum soli]|uniref:Chromate transporter n=1 Tax=Paraherbaspirillum soli TaxID=631222 RepID=A0ABW0MA85_9BURK
MRDTRITVEDGPREPITPRALFMAFAMIGLCGFGGILSWARRMLVDTKGWLTETEFTELLGFAQILPGANGTHLAVMFGLRCCGWRGAVAAVAGLLIPPFGILISLAVLYQWYGALPQVRGALKGMAAVAAGLSIDAGIRLARAQPRRARCFLLSAAAFVAIALLNLPLAGVMASLVPVSIGCELLLLRQPAWPQRKAAPMDRKEGRS